MGKKTTSVPPPRSNAIHFAGLTTLMNPKEMRKDIDKEEIERAFMGGSTTQAAESENPIDSYDRELKDIAKELGLDLLDAGTSPAADPVPKNTLVDDINELLGDANEGYTSRKSRRKYSSSDSFSSAESQSRSSGSRSSRSSGSRSSGYSGSRSGSSRSSGSSGSSGSRSGSSRSSGSSGSRSGSSRSGSASSSADSEIDAILDGIGADLGISMKKNARHSDRHRKVRHSPPDKNKSDFQGGAQMYHREPYYEANAAPRNITEDQEKRVHAESVISEMRGDTHTSHGHDRVRTQDIKARKLEEISRLLMTLEDEGVDCSSVKRDMPTDRSPMEDIDSVLNVLKHKNDSNRYSTMAEEMILGGAEMIETVFDGTRRIPVLGWKPDYTGYHNTVNVKLHRMRFETSQIVGTIIERNNIGSFARVFLELLPSFFLYPRQQGRKTGSGLYNDPAISSNASRGAYARINESDSRRDIVDLQNI